MNVLITGGLGFIGSHIAKKLLENDYTVKIVSNFKSGTSNLDAMLGKIELIKGDSIRRCKHKFKVNSMGPVTPNEASQLQTKLGFDPRGYGFDNFQSIEQPSGEFITTWNCWNSCD